MIRQLISLAERGALPDFLIRAGIRSLLKVRLRSELSGDLALNHARLMEFVGTLRESAIAVETAEANRQHYEVPSEYFSLVLGGHRKYSSCLFLDPSDTLERAEERMLAVTADRAEITDGMSILELGCGWGSLSLFLARRYPNAKITGVSNSNSQREYIMARAAKEGLSNVQIITADMNDFTPTGTFDRIVSVEMFEHMRNYEQLLSRISSWLNPAGKLFVHIFSHRETAYPFETEGDDNWMGRYFFTGGLMPSDSLLLYFQKHVLIENHWRVDGTHYQKTLEEWLKRHDANHDKILPVLTKTYGEKEAKIWFHRWRLFYLACSELFGFRNGREWFVSHYLFSKRGV